MFTLMLVQNIVSGRSGSYRFPSNCTFVLSSLDFKLSSIPSIQNISGMSLIGDESALGGEEKEKRDD